MLTQDDYKLYTGEPANFSEEDWAKLVALASKRLASFLCLEELPELTDDNSDLALLLANFICSTLSFRGNPEDVESKSVRNFTIKFREGAANAYAQVYKNYSDIINAYSECGSGIVVERTYGDCCYGC